MPRSRNGNQAPFFFYISQTITEGEMARKNFGWCVTVGEPEIGTNDGKEKP
jgi:hypothetical protein